MSAISPSGRGSGDLLRTPSITIGAPVAILPLSSSTLTLSVLKPARSIPTAIIPAEKNASRANAVAMRPARRISAVIPLKRHRAIDTELGKLTKFASSMPPAKTAASHVRGWRSYSRILRSTAIEDHLFDPDRASQFYETGLAHSANLQNMLNPEKWPVLIAKLHDRLGRPTSDIGQFLEFLDRCGVDIYGVCRRCHGICRRDNCRPRSTRRGGRGNHEKHCQGGPHFG